MIKIAIIDDGLYLSEKYYFSKVYNYVLENKKIVSAHTTSVNYISHGTICAEIIDKYCRNLEIELVSIKFLNSDRKGSADDLIICLEWCFQHQINLINLSNGIETYTNEKDKELCNICYKLMMNNTVIVAAQSNRNIDTIPAKYPFVISVEQIRNTHVHNPYLISDILTTGKHRIKHNLLSEKCNSYACAFASAYIANILEGSISLNGYGFKMFNHKPLYFNKKIDCFSLPYLFPYIKDAFVENDRYALTKFYNNDFHNAVIEKMMNIATIYLSRLTLCERINNFKKRYFLLNTVKRHIPNYSKRMYNELPIVSFYIGSYDDIVKIKKIADEINTDHYRVIGFSDKPSSVFLGFMYTKTEYLRNTLYYLCNIYYPDIAIIVSSCHIDYSDMEIDFTNNSVYIKETNKVFNTDIHSVKNTIYNHFIRE